MKIVLTRVGISEAKFEPRRARRTRRGEGSRGDSDRVACVIEDVMMWRVECCLGLHVGGGVASYDGSGFLICVAIRRWRRGR